MASRTDMMTHNVAVAESYLDICRELGAAPCQPFLQCLQAGSRACKLPAFDQEEQLYAARTILPYAGLQELDLSGLQLSLTGWVALLESCSKSPQLKVLSLKGCGLGSIGEDAQERLASLIAACQVMVLDISQNQLTDTFVLGFSETSLACGGSRLTVLDLSDNCITDEGVSALADALQADGPECQLKQLDLSFNKLADKGACALAAMMTSVPLLALELEGNQIGDAGVASLAAAAKNMPHLQRLNLNYNTFSSQALLALADAVRPNQGTLQELAVAGSRGKQDGMVALLQAACQNRHLQLLDVRGMPLHGQAVEAVCQLLTGPTAMTTLRLDVLAKEAAESIAQTLPKNNSLLHLMMGGPVPEHVLSFVAASLSANTLGRLQQPVQQQQQQRPSSTPAVSSRSPPGNARAHATQSILNRSPTRPRSAGPMGSTRPVLVRSTTQQARSLSTLDPTGIAGLAGGGASNKAAEVFRRHDSENKGYLDAEEMMSALQELGMLEGMKAKQLGKFLSNAIREADVDQDGRVSLEDFNGYYKRLARHYAEAARHGRITTRRKIPIIPVDAPSNELLKRMFKAYCRLPVGQGRQVGASIQHINAAQFHQLCRDAGLLEPSGPLSQCAVDVVFARCKPPGSRRLSYKEFLDAVASIADEAGCTFETVTQALTVITSTSPLGSPLSEQVEGDSLHVTRSTARTDKGWALGSLRISDLMETKVGPILPSSPKADGRIAASAELAFSERLLQPCTVAGSLSPQAAALRLYKKGVMTMSLPDSAGSWAVVSAKQGSQEQKVDSAAAVQNPLYEDGQLSNRHLDARLAAVEDKLSLKADIKAASVSADDKLGAVRFPGDIVARLLLAESQLAQQEQQLNAVTNQQEALQDVVTKLVNSLEQQQNTTNKAMHNDLCELQQQVKALSHDLGKVHALRRNLDDAAIESKMQELSRKVEDRQARAETAIYQVARQVDVLDSKLREEIESSMSALQAILSNASQVK